MAKPVRDWPRGAAERYKRVSFKTLAEAARDVVFGELVARVREDVVRVADLDQSPRWKYAVRWDTRAACCIECVTIDDRIVFGELVDQVLDLAVAIGSSAEHGSSMRITSGFTAIVRAMHSRCC